MAFPTSASPIFTSSSQLRSPMVLCSLTAPQFALCFPSFYDLKNNGQSSKKRRLGTECGFNRGFDKGVRNNISVSNSVLQLELSSRSGVCSLRDGNKSYSAFHSMDDDSRFPDGLIFEEGIFQDAFGAEEIQLHDKMREDVGTEPTGNGLIPEEWKQLQLELHKGKSERKKEILAEELENAKRKEINSRLKREPIDSSEIQGNSMDPHGDSVGQPPLSHTTEGSSLSGYGVNDGMRNSSAQVADSDDMEQVVSVNRSNSSLTSTASALFSQRAIPRNPRLSLGEASLEDIDRKLKERISAQQAQGPSKENIDSELNSFLTAEEKSLLKKRGPDISKVSTEKWMLLHTLATSGQTFLLDELLKQEIDINAVDKDGLTALQKAVMCKKEVAVGQLLRAGAGAKVRDKHGAGLLHYAVQTGSSSLVRLLIRCGIDVNPLDENGWSPLHLAAQSGRADIVKLLLVNGAKNSLNKDGLTPLDVSLAFGRGFNAYAVAKAIKKYSKI